MAVSMGDVARHAGVSQRTVSNVVNNYVHVSQATREKVEHSLAALGYRPNVAARQLRSGRTGTVTLALPGFVERYFADLADAVIRTAGVAGIRVLVETTAGDHDTELQLLTGGGGLLTDGLIMSAVSLDTKDHDLARAQYPLVLVGDRATRGSIDHVGIPNRRAARAAVEHLLDIGRTRIALMGVAGGQAGHSDSLRRRGYADALRARDIAVDPDLVISVPWSRDGGEAAAADLVASGRPLPDAIFAMNDSIGLGVLRGLALAGVRVPDDIAVIGFDDTAEARHSLPSLSSVSPSLDQIAPMALELISDQMSAGSDARESQHRHVDFSVVVRESTGT